MPRQAAKKAAKATKATDTSTSLATLDVQVIDVTPDMAGHWLEVNDVNRNIRPKLVNAYRRDMEHGRWEMTAEPIQISRTGRLLNGQHRLTALASSHGITSIPMVVAKGVPDHAQAMMDQGKARNVRDALLIEHGHVKNVTLVGAVCRWLVLCPEIGPQMTPNLMRGKVTTAECLEVYNEYSAEIDIACEEGSGLRAYLPGSPSAISFTYFNLLRVDAQACTEFFAGMKDMEWSWKDDPRKAAWRRMNYVHRDQEIKTSIETGVMMVSVLSRAWNAWRKQESVESIQVRSRAGLIPPVKPV